MELTIISDTHGKRSQLSLSKGDMLIHAGDVTSRGDLLEVIDFLDWFKLTDFKYKIFIAGNHDYYFEKASREELDHLIPEGVIYLNDSGCCVEGINIWGSPVQPWFYNWAFNRQRGDDIQHHWDMIPATTDILITHGPPFGILDSTIKGEQVGCENLLETNKRLNLKLQVFGHIHEAYGEVQIGKTKYINASVLNHNYQITNKPIIFQITE